MTQYRVTNNGREPLSASEEAALMAEWAAQYALDSERATDLTPNEFERMLDQTGLDDAWDALAAILKLSDRTAYADLQEERRKSRFRLSYTLQRVADFRPILTAAAYDISQLTDANITAQWNVILAARTAS